MGAGMGPSMDPSMGLHGDIVMDWTAEKARQATRTLVEWYTKTDGIAPDWGLIGYVERALGEDLNTHAALEELRTWSNSTNSESAAFLKAGMILLGFPPAEHVDWFRKKQSTVPGISYSGVVQPKIDTLERLMRRWSELRSEKSYREADSLKSFIEAAGARVFVIAGSAFAEVLHNFDPAKLEVLK